jgi:tetratricopeptide (TPR) repeat protein
VQAQTHTSATAQELILEEAFGLLAPRARTVAAFLAVAEVPLTADELQQVAQAGGQRPAHAARAVRDLAAHGFTQDFADGRVTLHDAVRPVASSVADDLTEESVRRVREALLPVLEGQRGVAQFGRWMRLLTETGRVDRLLDLASEEGFFEAGYPPEIRPVVADAAEDPARDTALRFEARNTLATWAYYDGDWEACARHVNAMEQLVRTGASGIGSRERALLATRQFLLFGHAKDVRRLTAAFNTVMTQVQPGTAEHRALRYSFAQGLYHAEEFTRADVAASQAADAYRAHLGLSLDELNGPTPSLQERLYDSDSPDDFKRLADCFSLSVRARRRQGVGSGPRTVAAVPATKLYLITGSWRQAVDSGQEVVDILMNTGKVQQALNILERQLLPIAQEYNLPDLMIGLRSHHAIVLAHAGDVTAALAEIDSLSGYEPTPVQAADIRRQKALIKAIAARQKPGAP